MPKRRKLKRTTRPHSTGAPVHDRRAQELPINALVAPVEIDDPYEPGAKIIALQSLRDSPLNYMRARGPIDEAQYNAGKKLQEFYERAENGYSISRWAQMRGMTGQLYTRYIGIRFREVLETLAVELKLVGR
jgi:hypothetical protein